MNHFPQRLEAGFVVSIGLFVAVLAFGMGSVSWAAGRPYPRVKKEARPATAAPAPVRAPDVPESQQSVSLSLVDALVAIKAEGLAGVFGYVAETNAAPALAGYLIRTPKALKLFIKKGERDFKAAHGINDWDKEVFLYIIGINSNAGSAGLEPLSPKMLDRVATLSLRPGLPLAAVTMGRQR